MRTSDIQGLYFQGSLIAVTYTDSVKRVFDLKEIPQGFCVNEDHKAEGYSIVDSRGVQNIYELSSSKFYNALMSLTD